jgi:hypothetical protein
MPALLAPVAACSSWLRSMPEVDVDDVVDEEPKLDKSELIEETELIENEAFALNG